MLMYVGKPSNHYNVAKLRLMVVSHDVKKEQSKLPKTKHAMNYCVSFTRTNVFII